MKGEKLMKKFLIVVDMQKDFIDGALGTKEAQAIVEPAVKAIEEAKAAGYTVLATMDTHSPDYLRTREGRYLPVEHCIRGTEGWALRPEIREAMGDAVIVEKGTFGSVDLPELIRGSLQPGDGLKIVLLGLCTDICVVSNALLLKAAFPEADMGVYTPGCAGVTPLKHEAALDTMASCQIDLLDAIE